MCESKGLRMSNKVRISSIFIKASMGITSNRIIRKLYEHMLWELIKKGEAPKHIGVILDGNRRWAILKVLAIMNGHDMGAKKTDDFLDWCFNIGKIQIVTLYIFSTENFRRPLDEVENIMDLLEKYLTQLLKDKRIQDRRVRVKIIGRTELLSPKLQGLIRKLEKTTSNYENFYLNLAIAYGGRAEIVDAFREIAQQIAQGKISPENIDEGLIEKHLYTHFLPYPHPDLVIRTSGEERLSNFLLWQSAYSELCFLDVYWPSFRKIDLLRAIRVFQQRHRKTGS